MDASCLKGTPQLCDRTYAVAPAALLRAICGSQNRPQAHTHITMRQTGECAYAASQCYMLTIRSVWQYMKPGFFTVAGNITLTASFIFTW